MSTTSGAEAATAREALTFIVGRDDRNHWVAIETHGMCGGIFADEATALRFAREESGRRPGAVLPVSHIAGDGLTLTMSPALAAIHG